MHMLSKRLCISYHFREQSSYATRKLEYLWMHGEAHASMIIWSRVHVVQVFFHEIA